ncbi:MAG: threonylcarbamoyl-AMP synthase [Clostridia bacterium]|nr:threonylcarbamoyl-AMP synthase [Clostridia bacterium]
MTRLVTSEMKNLASAAEIINNGGLVAFPTETVYGLGADGLNENAVKKIYEAKGRPSDNPLILHIQDISEVEPLTIEINSTAKKLMDTFWPGPMTLVFKKSAIVPPVISGGLDTVAIRLPENKVARELIRLSKTPIAAPSANTSGKPSPTKASHVFEDLNGRIDMIIDGGSCDIGLESTVIDVTTLSPVILRPGGVTFEDIYKLFPDVSYDKHLTLDTITDTVKPRSPGMKYKHYAPEGELFILEGNIEKVQKYILENSDENTAVFTFDGIDFDLPYVRSLGTSISGSKLFFDLLRECDSNGITKIFALMPDKKGVGFALYNRMFKAAGGRIIKL